MGISIASGAASWASHISFQLACADSVFTVVWCGTGEADELGEWEQKEHCHIWVTWHSARNKGACYAIGRPTQGSSSGSWYCAARLLANGHKTRQTSVSRLRWWEGSRRGWWPSRRGMLFQFHLCCSDKISQPKAALGKKGFTWLKILELSAHISGKTRLELETPSVKSIERINEWGPCLFSSHLDFSCPTQFRSLYPKNGAVYNGLSAPTFINN